MDALIAQAKQRGREGREARFAERVRILFPDGFTNLPKGFQFKPDDARLDLLSAVSSPSGNSLLIQVEAIERNGSGRERRIYAKYSLHKNGTLTPDVVQQIRGLDPLKVVEELLEKAQQIELMQWRKTSLDLNPIPLRHDATPARDSLAPTEREPAGPETDMQRLAFLAQLPEVLAMSVDARLGLQGYRLFLFAKGAILESPFIENAIYIVHFEDRIPQTKRELRTMPDNDLDALIRSRKGSEAILLPKRERLALPNVKRFNHQGDWQARVLAEVRTMSQ